MKKFLEQNDSIHKTAIDETLRLRGKEGEKSHICVDIV